MRFNAPFWMLLAGLLGLTACDRISEPRLREAGHSRYTDRIVDFGLDDTLMGRRWREAASRALREPTRVALPHAERGALLAHKADALGLTFDAAAGQVIEIGFAREAVTDAPADDGRVYIDVFRIEPTEAGVVYRRLRDVQIDGTSLHVPVPETAEYVVRVQPELLVNTLYGLTLELGAVLPFPIDGRNVTSIQSYFGDERDGGDRSHEGVDIFAERNTPVIAVADGRATPRQNNLGGNVVWLNTPGLSYYYAHLERTAVDGPTRVKAGDVLGYVGNTGNAATTPPHLHFGVYRWGRGAEDPMPNLVERRLPDEPLPDNEQPFLPRLASTDAAGLNLRVGPSTGAAVLSQLPRGTIVSVQARSGEWLRVDDSSAVDSAAPRGWIHSQYARTLGASKAPGGLAREVASRLAVILDSPRAAAQPIGIVDPGDSLATLAVSGGRPVVSAGAGAVTGWLAASP